MAIREGTQVTDDIDDNVDLDDTTRDGTMPIDDDDDDDFTVLVEGRDEIPDDDDVAAPQQPSIDELLNRVTQLQEQMPLQGQTRTENALNEGFSRLADSLKQQQQQGQPVTPQQTETYDALKKRLGKSFYDDPVAAMEEMLKYVAQTEIVPALNETRNMISSTAAVTSRQVSLANETNKLIYDKYKDEVESAVKQLPSSPDVYEKALQQVGMVHMNEIMEDRIQQAVQQALAGAATKPKPPATGVTPQGGGSRAPAHKAKRRVLPAHLRDLADAKGMSYEDMYRAHFGEK